MADLKTYFNIYIKVALNTSRNFVGQAYFKARYNINCGTSAFELN